MELAKKYFIIGFCSTSLQLPSTIWINLKSSTLCPLFLIVPSINLSSIKGKILWNAENQTQAAGWEASMLPLCYAVPPDPPLLLMKFFPMLRLMTSPTSSWTSSRRRSTSRFTTSWSDQRNRILKLCFKSNLLASFHVGRSAAASILHLLKNEFRSTFLSAGWQLPWIKKLMLFLFWDIVSF